MRVSNKSLIEQKPDYLVCTCMGIMYSDLVAEIQAGKKTFEELSELLMVGTGCTSCVDEVKEILAEQLG